MPGSLQWWDKHRPRGLRATVVLVLAVLIMVGTALLVTATPPVGRDVPNVIITAPVTEEPGNDTDEGAEEENGESGDPPAEATTPATPPSESDPTVEPTTPPTLPPEASIP